MPKDETYLVNGRTIKRSSVSYSGTWMYSSFLGARVKLSVAFASKCHQRPTHSKVLNFLTLQYI